MKVGFIGAGNMVGAIVRGAVASEGLKASDIYLTDRSGKSAPKLAEEVGANVSESNEALARSVDVVVLGVKPYAIEGVLTEISGALADSGALVISLAAGKPLAALERAAGGEIPVIRVMPNVNAAIGESMTGIAAGTHATAEHISQAKQIMSTVGRYLVIEESEFSIFAALAGSSPAWMYQIVESFARAGVKHGLTKDQAVAIVAQSMAGSAQMILDQAASEGATPSDLVDRVCSPGGTTIAGLLAAEQAGLTPVLVSAVDAAVRRDRELA
ncbi:MAG: pyrroline-5-carboxylate reductase [Actinomycetaceae bacterium]|nr:pyrroline-5-carboxylate reductase [Actinomycetaceae bacterium]